jgi:hypothetical protein
MQLARIAPSVLAPHHGSFWCRHAGVSGAAAHVKV